jgi:NADH dehydrogenase
MGKPRIVIIGGGFAGLAAAQGLRKADVELTVVDRTNHHLFQPLLYQVASAALAPRDIAFPIREILKKQANTSVIMADVNAIDSKSQRVILSSERCLDYDYLIVAVGTRHSYFQHPEWEVHAPGLKTLEDALAIRRRILTAFEAAEIADSREEAQGLLSFAVIGGGPTGVELAGAIAEIAQQTMLKNFRRIDPSDTKVFLIEAGPRLLSSYPSELSEQARKDLESLGVTVLTDTPVVDIDADGVHSKHGFLSSPNVFWGAGNEAPPLLRTLDSPLDPQGRVLVEPDLSLPKHPHIFVIGDAAHLEDAHGHPLPGVAPVAMQQGRYVAQLIQAEQAGKPRKDFRYHDKGSMATIGKAKAVAVIGQRCFSGLFAWCLWSLIHIAFLIGFRNRSVVMLEWIFWYVTGKRGSRLIHEAPSKHRSEHSQD